MTRKSTGKKLRFEIFKRDGFTCQYCGAQPPDVVLVIDHIKPVSQGGDNDLLNLITACESCNQGKADKPLGSISPKPDADIEWLNMQQEIAELRRYLMAKSERDQLEDEITESLQNDWAYYFSSDTAPKKFVFSQWLSWAEPDQIEEAIRKASSKSYKLHTFEHRLRYVAGVLHGMTGTKRQDNDE